MPFGPIKQLSVGRGDTLTVTAHGLYLEPARQPSWVLSLAGYVASLVQQQPAGPLPADGKGRVRVWPLLNIGLPLAGVVPQLAGGVPRAYLRVLVFNKDSVLTDTRTQQLTQAALGTYEPLQISLVVPEAGYATAYVATESEADVFFDDIYVEHGQGLQVQETHYDPYGVELAGLSTSSHGLKQLNQYTWNGKEKQTEFGLNWQDHGWRFYDPTLGRWVVVDPDAEEGDQEGWTTYQFGLNNAVRYNDLDGRRAQGPGDEGPTVARMIVDFGASAVNLYTSYLAYSTGSSTKLQAQVYEDDVSLGVQYAIVPVGTMAQEAKSTALDAVNVALNVMPASRAGAGRAFEQGAKRVIAAEAGAAAQGPITGYTKHGLNQAIGRNGGKGVKASAMVDAVSSPKKVVAQPNGTTKYAGRDATVVTNSDGKVVTTFGKGRGPKVQAEPRPARGDGTPGGRAAPGGGAAQRRALQETGANYNPKAIR